MGSLHSFLTSATTTYPERYVQYVLDENTRSKNIKKEEFKDAFNSCKKFVSNDFVFDNETQSLKTLRKSCQKEKFKYFVTFCSSLYLKGES